MEPKRSATQVFCKLLNPSEADHICYPGIAFNVRDTNNFECFFVRQRPVIRAHYLSEMLKSSGAGLKPGCVCSICMAKQWQMAN